MEKINANKAGGIGLREIIAAAVIVVFLGGSLYMLLSGLISRNTESKVTPEEAKAAWAAEYDDSDNEGNVNVAAFENDIVIDKKGKVKKQPATQTDTDTKAESQPAEDKSSSEYIFPDSDIEYLTAADVSGMSKENLRKGRNEILARHGRIFDSEDLKAYFEGKSWYSGTVPPEEFDKNMDSRLNAIELSNIELIKKYE